MPYLVTYLPAPTVCGVNLPLHKEHDNESDARDHAEAEMRAGATEVAVWELYAQPKLTSIVEW